MQSSPTVCRDKADSRLCTDPAITLGCLHRDGFMSSVHQADSYLLTSHQKCIQVTAMESKGNLHAKVFQGLGQQITTCQFAALWVVKWEASHDGYSRNFSRNALCGVIVEGKLSAKELYQERVLFTLRLVEGSQVTRVIPHPKCGEGGEA